MKIMDFLNKKAILMDIKATDKEGVIRELADLLADATGMKNKEDLIKRIPSGRFGSAEEIAKVVLFLAGDSAGYITGQVIKVDGGLVM